ncbi:aminopeptidase O isoform 3-T4 [Anomaloglossus baeobatrachus]|uniref:aminopeptidase O isoform X3 n=1 Tax=Anomaloglossus baeobatrachus TaxID=238106 RepID=UPI003F50A81C
MAQQTDDLPLMANTSHILVKHYALDLDVCFESQTISGNIVLFLQPNTCHESEKAGNPCHSQVGIACGDSVQESGIPHSSKSLLQSSIKDSNSCPIGERDTSEKYGCHGNKKQTSGITSSENGCDRGNHGSGDFVLVLDCCDLSVLKVEEVDVTGVPEKCMTSMLPSCESEQQVTHSHQIPPELVSLPASRWKEQLSYYMQCSRASGCGELNFSTDTWSLQISKCGVNTPSNFPSVVRIWYKTTANGRSVKWTKDQSGRPCVFTFGSPINNRALFPCQEPPMAMSTWDATVRTHSSSIVLMSGENFAAPNYCSQGICSWFYYVTMPMPASTFTIAVGSWTEVKNSPSTAFESCQLSRIMPLNMDKKSPHIIYLTQSVLSGRNQLCISRVCHEIAHAWFGLAIGAHDWTEEWISEGFATHLEDVFLANVLKLSEEESKEHQDLKALLRWRRLNDEISNSQEELQILRPQGESTGEVSESGSTMVRHGLNADKTFMQVHYLKGYFLLRYLANTIGADTYFSFLRRFVNQFHGQLILSQDFLHMLLETVPEHLKHDLSLDAIYQIWLDPPGMPQPLLEESQTWTGNGLVQQVKQEVSKWIRLNQRNKRGGTGRKRKRGEEFDEKIVPDQLVLLLDLLLEEKTLCAKTLQCLKKTYSLQEQDAEIRHRWCELVIKHKYIASYKDVETFLLQDQVFEESLHMIHLVDLKSEKMKYPLQLITDFHKAMGVYLYGELMVNEDARQQELAHRCFAAVRDQMDVSCVKVVGEMLF